MPGRASKTAQAGDHSGQSSVVGFMVVQRATDASPCISSYNCRKLQEIYCPVKAPSHPNADVPAVESPENRPPRDDVDRSEGQRGVDRCGHRGEEPLEELRLNASAVGPDPDDPTYVEPIDEVYTITHGAPALGQTGEVIHVTAFGRTQTFYGVESIVGQFGDSAGCGS